MERIVNFQIPTRLLRSQSKAFGIVLALAFATSFSHLRGDEPPQTHIAYPAGYREWVHVKSGVLGPEFPMESERGLHHVYANKTALEGIESGTFQDGSIVVYDLISLSEKGGVGTEGARRRIDVMVRDSKLYAASGGWGFGRFMGNDREHDVLTPEVRAICIQCHEKQKAHGFVFSEFRK